MANLKNDRRSQRTRHILHEALMSLMQEKRYDNITVQDIIARADVGRSTYYAHYQDKEELMVSSFMYLMEYLTQAVSQPDGEIRRLLPTCELFEHVQENHQLIRSVIRGRDLNCGSSGFNGKGIPLIPEDPELFIEKGQEFWSQKVTAELWARLPAGKEPAIPIEVMAQFAAGTMVTMLRWWLDNKMPYSPQEMDRILNQLVMA